MISKSPRSSDVFNASFHPHQFNLQCLKLIEFGFHFVSGEIVRDFAYHYSGWKEWTSMDATPAGVDCTARVTCSFSRIHYFSPPGGGQDIEKICVTEANILRTTILKIFICNVFIDPKIWFWHSEMFESWVHIFNKNLYSTPRYWNS